MTTAIAFVIVAAFAVLIHRFVARGSDRSLFRLDQFRPAAPLAGFLPGNHDAERAFADLAAIHAHSDETSPSLAEAA